MRSTLPILFASCLIVGCSQPSAPVTATPGPNGDSPSSAPAAPAGASASTASAVPTDAVATVLGQPIKRSDCLSSSYGIGSEEVGIHVLVLKLLTEDFSKAQSVTLTDEEIGSFWKALRSAAAKANPDPSKPLPEPVFDESAVQGRLKQAQDKLAAPDLPLLEKMVLESQIQSLQRGLEMKSQASVLAYEHLVPLRLEEALYKKYGGKVVARQISLQAAGAYLKLAEEAQANGQLKFHDPTLQQAFWQRLNDDLAYPEVPPERVDFSLPLWMQSAALPAPADAATPAAPAAKSDAQATPEKPK